MSDAMKNPGESEKSELLNMLDNSYAESAVLVIQPTHADESKLSGLIAELRRTLRNTDLVALHRQNVEITLIDEKPIELRSVLGRIDNVMKNQRVKYHMAMAASPYDGPEDAALLATARIRLEQQSTQYAG